MEIIIQKLKKNSFNELFIILQMLNYNLQLNNALDMSPLYA